MGTRATLAGLAILLAGAIWAETRHGVLSGWLTPDAASAVRPGEAGDGRPAQRAEPFVVPSVTPLELMTQTVTRPLFSPNRRPPEVVAGAPAPDLPVAAPAQPPQVTLTAVVITELDRVALLRVNGSDELLRLREGQEVAGWQLKEVSAEGVTLAQGDKTHEVALRTYQPVAAPAPPRSRRRRENSNTSRRKRQNDADEESSQRRSSRRSSRRRSGRNTGSE